MIGTGACAPLVPVPVRHWYRCLCAIGTGVMRD
jgi:hypothetical protein